MRSLGVGLLLLSNLTLQLNWNVFQDKVAWQEFSPPEGGFSVSFPGKPKTTSSIIQLGNQRIVVKEVVDHDFKVSYFDIPIFVPDNIDPKKVFESLPAAIANEMKGSIVRRMAVVLDSNPGMLLEIRSAKGSAHITLLLVGRRIYRNSMNLNEQTLTDENRKAYERFLSTFRLKPIAVSEPGTDDTYINREPGEVDDYLVKEKVYAKRQEDPHALYEPNLINAKPISLPRPEFSSGALGFINKSASIIVHVVISEDGKVVAAQIVKGHPMLREGSLKAVRQAVYVPASFGGTSVKALGTIEFIVNVPLKL